MLFPKSVKTVYAADFSGSIKARLRPGIAARDVRRKKARKISDNLIQYYAYWEKREIALGSDEVILLGTVSRYTKRRGWLKADRAKINVLLAHNSRVVRCSLPNLSF